jgi:NTE family protein
MPDLFAPQPKVSPQSSTTGVVSGHGQIVLVLQGGGALGAFQAGVYHALHDAGVEPDWVIGTSIGAINASIIVGNEPGKRLAALEEFWQRIAHQSIWGVWSPQIALALANWTTVTAGLPGFFAPNPFAFLGAHIPLGTDNAGYYTTAPLKRTLSELVDFSLIKRNKPRLTVGAAHVETSQMRYFDSLQTEINVKHVLASGALPPAFPAVCIDGEHYWDGGILSNTPTEAVFDDNPRRNSLVFAVHMWNPVGPAPQSMWEVLHRQKDIQYSSRVATHIARQAQIHRLRHVIKELAAYIPEEMRASEEVQALAAYGCLTRMHFVRLLSPRFDNEDHTKDIDFSPTGIRQRWQSGYDMAMRAIENAPWNGAFDPHEGVFLHEPTGSMPLTAVASAEGMGQPISLASDQYATTSLP